MQYICVFAFAFQLKAFRLWGSWFPPPPSRGSQGFFLFPFCGFSGGSLALPMWFSITFFGLAPRVSDLFLSIYLRVLAVFGLVAATEPALWDRLQSAIVLVKLWDLHFPDLPINVRRGWACPSSAPNVFYVNDGTPLRRASYEYTLSFTEDKASARVAFGIWSSGFGWRSSGSSEYHCFSGCGSRKGPHPSFWNIFAHFFGFIRPTFLKMTTFFKITTFLKMTTQDFLSEDDFFSHKSKVALISPRFNYGIAL